MSSINAASAAGSQLNAQVGIAVAAKTLDAARAQGDAAVSLLQDAAQLQKQIESPAEPGRGRLVDVLG